jgi:hypothetical protein
MFRSENDLIPRTYSVKSFKIKKTIRIKRLIAYSSIGIILLSAGVITFLSIMGVI